MEKLSQLKEVLESIEVDAQKFYEKGTKAAGVRVRKGLQEIKALAQDIRKEISAINNGEKEA